MYGQSVAGSWPQWLLASRVALATMGRAVYLDCFSGASGDMLLGALKDKDLGVVDQCRTARHVQAVG